jgi:nucleotide-binding universal stress UspA family protein
MLPIRTVLHPTDFSQHSDYAFRLACSLARDHGARLMVLHVLERPLLTYTGVMTAPPPPPPSVEQRQAVQEQLHRIKPPDSAIVVEHLLEEGDPATAILQVAQERRCELIVMGTHGRTGLPRLLMGSVAEQIVRKAPCPVLTVRLPQRQAPPSEAPVPAPAGGGKETGK